MSADTPAPSSSRGMLWTGYFLSTLPVLLLLMSAGMKLSRNPDVLKGLAKYGYPESVVIPLGVVELVSTVLYIVPQTAVLGAILLTGYLGGATATHVHAGDTYIMPVIVGVVLWIGLCLRDARLRQLVPLRRRAP